MGVAMLPTLYGMWPDACAFRVSTALAILPLQPPPKHQTKRTIFDLPSKGRGGEPILVLILSLAVGFHHSIILSTARTPVETEQMWKKKLSKGTHELHIFFVVFILLLLRSVCRLLYLFYC